MITRRTPLRRSTKPIRRTALPRRSKPIAKQSKRQRAKQAQLKIVENERRAIVGNECEAKILGVCCNGLTHPHHLLGRAVGSNHHPDGIRLLCNFCNVWIEDHPTEAAAMGLRFKSWQASTVIGGTKELVAAKNNSVN